MKKFFSLHLFMLMFLLISGNLFAQYKLNEGFEGATFPPAGWSTKVVVAGSGAWARSTATPHTGLADAVSNFTTAGADNYLVTKRFTPGAGDSLVFWMAQVFTAVYADSLDIKVSTTDSLNFPTLLLHLRDGVDYPLPAGTYKRFAVSLNAYAGMTVWVAFRHVDLDGDDVRLDDITVGTAIANDVAVTGIIQPAGQVALNSGLIAPKATIANLGTANQLTPFNVTCKITPGTYTSTKTDTVSAGSSNVVTFDSTFNPTDTGVYTITVYTSLASDGNRSNDTLRNTFHIFNADYGLLESTCPYYFATSQAPSNVSHPTYCWKDTTNSKSLIVNGVVASGLVLTGTLDDGYFKLRVKDLVGGDSTKQIRFCGTCYDSIFPSTNGIIGLVNNAGLTSFSPVTTNTYPAVYPFWRDMDWRFVGAGGAPNNRMSVKVSGTQLIVTYAHSQFYNLGVIGPDYISFQVCFELVSGCASNSNIRFSYADTTGGKTSASVITKYIGSNANNATTNLGTHLVALGTPATAVYRYQNPTGTTIRPLYTSSNTSLAVEFGSNPSTLKKCDCRTLLICLALEGLQNNPAPRVRDTVTITIKNASTAPYATVESYKVFLDSATESGYSYGRKYVQFTLAELGTAYYIVVQHRNSIRTWSRSGGETFGSDTLGFDFTTSVTKAFGSNMTVVHGAASMYTGDVNQDGCVDVSDIIAIYNDASNFVSGDYIITDLNYDGAVDLSDIVLAYNNSSNFVCEVAPPGATSPFVINKPEVKESPGIMVPYPFAIDKEKYFRKLQNAK